MIFVNLGTIRPDLLCHSNCTIEIVNTIQNEQNLIAADPRNDIVSAQQAEIKELDRWLEAHKMAMPMAMPKAK